MISYANLLLPKRSFNAANIIKVITFLWAKWIPLLHYLCVCTKRYWLPNVCYKGSHAMLYAMSHSSQTPAQLVFVPCFVGKQYFKTLFKKYPKVMINQDFYQWLEYTYHWLWKFCCSLESPAFIHSGYLFGFVFHSCLNQQKVTNRNTM